MIIFNPSLNIFYSDKINDQRYFAGFSTKALGDGRNVNALFRFLDKNKISYRKLVVLDQIHSINIHFFEKSHTEGVKVKLEKIEDTDGIITDQQQVVLTVQTADCLPLLFVDKSKGLIGASHQGWRGSLKKMAVKMVSELIKRGSRPENITVAFGPAIGACCYDINDDRYYQFLEEFDGYSDKIFHFEKGRRHLNLALLNYLQLLETGLKKENLDFFPFCTKCDQKRFFSFRRDGGQEYGEMFSFIIKLYDA